MFQPARIKLLLFILIIFSAADSLSGQNRIISGVVKDSTGIPVQSVIIRHPESLSGTATDKNGWFKLILPAASTKQTIEISCVGYNKRTIVLDAGEDDIDLPVIILNEQVLTLDNISVTAVKRNEVTSLQIPVNASFVIPSVSRSIEAVIRTLPGVASYSELSNQYSVRGGSYDENLVYIDGVEIYHPYLIRYGQQEGLSQINPGFVSSVAFSPGGFSALYGDRMSSVLDVKYRKPETPEASVTASLLTSSAHLGLVSKDKKYFLMAGARYKTNALLVKTLDEEGQFHPSFLDLQSYGGMRTGEHSQIRVLLSASSNQFYFIPESQSTTFGSITGAYNLYASFDGCEKDKYSNLLGTITFESGSGKSLYSQISVSGLAAFEIEAYDIRGAYSLDAIDDLQSTHFTADSSLNIGLGSWLDHARNRLRYNTITLSYKGTYNSNKSNTIWGVTSRLKETDININIWQRVDSSGYTVGSNGEELAVTSFYNNICDYRELFSEAYFTENIAFSLGRYKGSFNAGVRAFYDTFNNEVRLSPRIAIDIFPSQSLTVYVTGGLYRQPVSGRELMQFIPEEASELTSQKSYHLASGLKYDFIAWDRPFRFTAEMYGKLQRDLIPYKVENVRIDYFGGNIAHGYTVGLDMRVNGEFVEGAESWFSLSIMKSAMEIPSLKTRWFPSPFDQRVNANIFFQDYLPGHPEFRAHVNLVYGSGVPVSPPERDTWDVFFRMPPYRRIDLGFSKVFAGEANGHHIGKPGSVFRELSAGVEIFNLADIRNVISYTWIKTVQNSDGLSGQYAVPNYLTRRRLNFRITARF